MKNLQSIRRPMLALIAGSALLLGGAAMPKFCLQNPTMLYVLGEARMAVGDHDGGLRMIGYATEHNGTGTLQTVKETAKPAATETKTPVCTKRPAVQNSKSMAATMVRYQMPQSKRAKYFQLAKLDYADFPLQGVERAKFEQEIHRATEASYAARVEHSRHVLSQVRMELERQGIAVPPAIAIAPVPPQVTP